MKKTYFIILLFCINNVFSQDSLLFYQYCLQDLNNYNTIGYKAHLFNSGNENRNINSGFLQSTNNIFSFAIIGGGYVKVIKNGEYYYTRSGDFYFDFEENKIVNNDGYALEINNQININTNEEDLMGSVYLYKIDVQNSITVDGVYFKYESLPENDYESRIIFGYLEISNTSAFYCLLKMRYILYTSIEYSINTNFFLETINMLIYMLNVDEYACRDENWVLIQMWLPYLEMYLEL